MTSLGAFLKLIPIDSFRVGNGHARQSFDTAITFRIKLVERRVVVGGKHPSNIRTPKGSPLRSAECKELYGRFCGLCNLHSSSMAVYRSSMFEM